VAVQLQHVDRHGRDQRIEGRVIGIDRQATLATPGGTSSARARAVSSVTLRGDFGKNTKPT
jgi:hypothetical protein